MLPFFTFYDEEIGEEEEPVYLPDADEEFYERHIATFKKMTPEDKWTLSTGKVVEDELFKFGKKCNYEHLCHSWILDTNDKNYTIEGHFTEEELQEIKSFQPVALPDIPDNADNYLSSLCETTTADLRKKCLTCPWSENFSRDTDTDLEWIFCTMHMMIREYESGNLMVPHDKFWNRLRIWSMVDRLFDYMPGIETVSEESADIGKSTRKNKDHIISTITRMNRSRCRYDLLLQTGMPENLVESETIFQRHLRVPKMLKDMLSNLATLCQHEEARVVKLKTVGYIQLGLSMEILIMDAPKGNIARLTRSIIYNVPKHVSGLDASLLPLLSVLLSTKVQYVKKVWLDKGG
ncbi:hypothetical protein BC943DRAFT_329805 [Umbelopsis sp. AD052]|nr:hypothetical protein BC943DRAFT_329805 [Umbelopsis sp. AD052]